VQQICERVIVISEGELVVEDRVEVLGERLTGGTQLQLTVRGPAEQTEKLLSGIDGVQNVVRVEEAEPPHRFVVTSETAADVREEVFFALASEGWPLLEIRAQEHSLEDIYLKLTSEDERDKQEALEVVEEVTDNE
jgi:ABC-2 type transport system ATP-binding protein